MTSYINCTILAVHFYPSGCFNQFCTITDYGFAPFVTTCNYFAHFHHDGFTNHLCTTIDYGFMQTFYNASDTNIICNHFAHPGGFLHQCCTIIDYGFKSRGLL